MKDRDARLYKYWLGHPRMTLQNIGNVFKIKHRQQVFMIIKREKELAGVELHKPTEPQGFERGVMTLSR